MNRLKIITGKTYVVFEKDVNEFFDFLDKNNFKIQNTKYHIEDESEGGAMVAFIQYKKSYGY